MRRKKEGHSHEMMEEMRHVCCPVCGHRIMDAAISTQTQLVVPMEGRYPDFIIKCGHCGAKVGVARAETQEN